MKYLANAFSLQMLPSLNVLDLRVERLEGQPSNLAELVSYVGHQDTANVLGVAYNRSSLSLQAGDELYVCQLMGGRLPEGATTLPEGFHFQWFKVTIL